MWGPPVAVPGASSSMLEEDDVTLSSSGDEMFFAVVAANGEKDLYSMTRSGGTWGAPMPMPFNSVEVEETPRLSADGRTLYFGSSRPGGVGGGDIWMVTRSAVGGTWSQPQLVPGVNTPDYEKWFMPCDANGTYVMVQDRDNGDSSDVVEGTLGGPASPVDVLSSSDSETGTFLTADCLTIYFASTRGQSNDIYRASRASLQSAWSEPTVMRDFGVGDNESDPWESTDGHTFAFASDKAGTNDIYLSTR
jgi:Tol biopolymer transport system component